MPTEWTRQVYDAVRRIPRGKVASYGGVAAVLGKPRAARGVGTALKALTEDDDDVPWWRVVNRLGMISPGGTPHRPQLQRKLLQKEGVRFGRGDAVDWRKYGWDGESNG